jgi:hypothetical protein
MPPVLSTGLPRLFADAPVPSALSIAAIAAIAVTAVTAVTAVAAVAAVAVVTATIVVSAATLFSLVSSFFNARSIAEASAF